MESVNNSGAMGLQLNTLKKAIEVQGETVLKVLESAGVPGQAQQASGASVTGIGQNLDVKA